VTWFAFGPVCATRCANTDASAHAMTITRKSARNANATLLRRSRRQASAHGLRPTIAVPCSSAASSAAVSSVNSVAGSVEIGVPRLEGYEGAPGGAPSCSTRSRVSYFMQMCAKSNW
jgi:23S rRNA C2498 (ribose-2'-O)-methylase RlmM